ncbi:MAG TPA: hypothetical protein VE077_14535 [Candidatus Methylomirabilis sp.]|nr:hypothetical protein [Candidatus Methylomirabilis sp.]
MAIKVVKVADPSVPGRRILLIKITFAPILRSSIFEIIVGLVGEQPSPDKITWGFGGICIHLAEKGCALLSKSLDDLAVIPSGLK